jgi:hypothetical protein
MAKLSKVLRSADDGQLIFWCPGCDGAHGVGVGEGSGPRWSWNNDIDKPTFSPSILVTYGHGHEPPDICHSFVKDGMIQFLGDCTHSLANQTVELGSWD